MSVAGGSLCAVCGGVRRSGKAEESNPGGALPGASCGAHPAGPGDVHGLTGGHGGIPQGQQDPAAHGKSSKTLHLCRRAIVVLFSVLESTRMCLDE